MKFPHSFFGFTVALLLLNSSPGAPVISEFVAVGNATYVDGDADLPDWIELHNPDADAIELVGYHLTDDATNLTKWAFPATALPGDGYLVVFASGKDRAVAGGELHTSFKLTSAGEYLALVAPDGITVVSEFAPAFPKQVEGYSYGIGSGANAGYLENPSPGAANGVALPGLLFAPSVTPAGATFTDSTEVALHSAFPGGQIRYTTDGTNPNLASTLYAAALSLSETTHLRAAVFDPESGERGVIAGAQFIRLASASDFAGLAAPAAFTSNLPIIVCDNFGAGDVPLKTSPTLQTARIAIYEVDPATGRSSLANPPDASLRIGMRIRGQTSGGAGFPKKQYKVELRDENDDDLDHPLLGLPKESDWIFNGPYIDKTFIRNALAYSLGQTIGIEASNTKHFEMFLNTDGGDVSASDYVGIYVLLEKIKNGKNRTDIAGIDPGDNSEPEISGGYMMRFDQGGNNVPDWGIEIIEPKTTTSQQKAWLKTFFTDFGATLGWTVGTGPNNTGIINNDPLTGYPAYIDTDSFVHLMVINEMFNSGDSYIRSDYFFKDREGKLHKGPLWDFNQAAGTHNSISLINVWRYQRDYNRGSGLSYTPDWLFPLMRDPDFKQKFIDRWFELRMAGVLEEGQLNDLIDSLADPLLEASDRNYIRWPGILTQSNFSGFHNIATDTWSEQIDELKDWFHTRMTWMDSEFLSPVSFAPESGAIDPGRAIALSNTGDGIIYYTVDGSDPRLPGGGINPSARSSSTSLVERTSLERRSTGWAYFDGGELAAGWQESGFDASAWPTSTAPLGFGSITNNPFGGAWINPDRHLTVYFRKEIEVADASLITLANGSVMSDGGAILYLNGIEIARDNMPADPVGFDTPSLSDSNTAEGTFDEFSFPASSFVDGTNVIAVELHNRPGSGDMGMDLELKVTASEAGSGPLVIDTTSTVVARVFDTEGNEWSAPAEATFITEVPASSANIAISEIYYNPPGIEETDEFIELLNFSDSPVSLAGVAFTSGIAYSFPSDTILAAGEHLILANGTYFGNLANDGETLTLTGHEGITIASFRFRDSAPWPVAADGNGHSLTLIFPGADPSEASNWRASVAAGGSPGGSDSTTFGGGGGAELPGYALSDTGGLEIALEPFENGGLVDDYLVVTALLNPGADDVAIDVQFSTDLSTWQSGTAIFLGSELKDGVVHRSWRSPDPVDPDGAPGFARLSLLLRD